MIAVVRPSSGIWWVVGEVEMGELYSQWSAHGRRRAAGSRCLAASRSQDDTYWWRGRGKSWVQALDEVVVEGSGLWAPSFSKLGELLLWGK